MRINALTLLRWTGDGGKTKHLSRAKKKKKKRKKEKERHYPTYFLDSLRPIKYNL